MSSLSLDATSSRGSFCTPRTPFPWLLLGALIAVWYPAVNHLRFEWTLNEQYQFGWVVPWLAAYLCFLRWHDCPRSSGPLSRGLVIPVGALCLFGFAPLLLLDEVNPDWRLLGYVTTSLSLILTMLGLGYVGGAAWLRHFRVPILFFIVAVPWPKQWEGLVMEKLMRTNAAVAVEVLNLAGAPASQEGNVVNLGTTHVGVNEACSGVRSLQCAIMIGVLLGELYRLPVARRLGLLAAAISIALLWNCVRTLILVTLALRWGASAMEAWHDRVGLAVLLAWVASVMYAGRFFRLPGAVPVESRGIPGESAVGAELGAEVGTGTENPWSRIPRSWSIAAIGWVVLASIEVEVWYHSSGAEEVSRFAWTVQWPGRLTEFREVSIPERVRVDLRYDRGTNKAWADEAGKQWSAFCLDWDSGRNGKLMSRLHRPDYCLPSTGRILVSRGEALVTVNGIELPFRIFYFRENGVALTVFFGVFSSGERTTGNELLQAGEDLSEFGLPIKTRVNAVLSRSRNFAQRQLEFAVWSVEDEAEVLRRFRGELERILEPEKRNTGF